MESRNSALETELEERKQTNEQLSALSEDVERRIVMAEEMLKSAGERENLNEDLHWIRMQKEALEMTLEASQEFTNRLQAQLHVITTYQRINCAYVKPPCH